MGGTLPDVIDELLYLSHILCEDGTTKAIKEYVTQEMDARNDWLRMGVPCDLSYPFVIGTIP